MASTRLQKLQGGLANVQRLFLPPVRDPSGAAYTPDDLHRSAAYIAIAHAEIQHYLDDRTKELAQRAKSAFSTKGLVGPELIGMIAYLSDGLTLQSEHQPALSVEQKFNPPKFSVPAGYPIVLADICHTAMEAYEAKIRTKNNGIKSSNITKLLLPLGFSASSLYSKWLAKMDALGTDRGNQVHKSLGTTIIGDPFSFADDINKALSGDPAWSVPANEIGSLNALDAAIDARLALLA